MENIKVLHEWEIAVEQEVEETTNENRDGQDVKVTKKVKKPIVSKLALKQPTRRELRSAELFYGTEYNKFVTMGFLPRSILINKHLDLTGGILSNKERDHIAKLTLRESELQQDLVRAIHEPEVVRNKIHAEIAGVRNEIVSLNSANESVFSQTAEVKAQNQLGQWFALNLIYVYRNSKWEQYFEGDSFDKKEEFLFKLEETNDVFYQKAIDKITTYIHFFNLGANRPEQFKAIDDELKKQFEQKKLLDNLVSSAVESTDKKEATPE